MPFDDDVTPDRLHLLARYDAALRGEAELPSALTVDRDGPVLRATYPGRRGFITHDPRGLDALTADEVRRLVARALDHVSAADATEVEWKTRAHDHAMSVLDGALRGVGFVPGEPESVMIGSASRLVDAPVPSGVTIRRLDQEDEIRRMSATADTAFGEDPDPARAESLLRRVDLERGTPEAMQLWVAEVDGEFVCTGRLEPVPGTEFAGVWGGATLPQWRGRGIYRALTAARARAALDLGKTLIQSDSTTYSRPILERSGFLRVTETTPYEWHASA